MTKILLVEDDSNLREIYAASLEAEDYETITASDGEEALAVAVRERPDLVILDVMMPKISGFDVLDILRSTPEVKNAKIIMMTALSQQSDKERGEKLGADRYLIKSQITIEDMVAVVAEVLATPSAEPEAPAPVEASEDIFIPNLPIEAAVAEAGQQLNAQNNDIGRTELIDNPAPAPIPGSIVQPSVTSPTNETVQQPETGNISSSNYQPADTSSDDNQTQADSTITADEPTTNQSDGDDDSDTAQPIAQNDTTNNEQSDQEADTTTIHAEEAPAPDFDENLSDEQAIIAEASQQNSQNQPNS
ncbi:response regulator [Candidatus Saccharibacteria bacterium]|nr:response regulator [Candidatus Saccharibacteria bacterium]